MIILGDNVSNTWFYNESETDPELVNGVDVSDVCCPNIRRVAHICQVKQMLQTKDEKILCEAFMPGDNNYLHSGNSDTLETTNIFTIQKFINVVYTKHLEFFRDTVAELLRSNTSSFSCLERERGGF